MSAAPVFRAATDGNNPAYEWKAVLLLSLALGLVGLDRWIIAPLAPAITADLHLKPQDINNLVAILGVTCGIAAVLMGSLRDCQFAIDDGDTVFAPRIKALLLRAVVLARRRHDLAETTRLQYRRRLDQDLDAIIALTPKTATASDCGNATPRSGGDHRSN